MIKVENTLLQLESRIRVRSGDEFLVVRPGISLVLFYAKPMYALVESLRRLIDAYTAFIPPDSLKVALGTSGGWRQLTPRKLPGDFRKLSTADLDYWSIHLSSGPAGSVGDYGFHFLGSNFLEKDLCPRETCVCFLEFPLSEIETVGRERFEDFVVGVADIERFECGYAGYAFQHLMETWRDEVLAWISQRARRFAAVDISYDQFRREARGRVVNVSWLTLIGSDIVDRLGSEQAIREKLSERARIRPMRYGLMLIAGDSPPIGDVNRGASDISALKEVAALVKAFRIPENSIKFGSEDFRRSWLLRLD